jgi:hypothetical protein
MADDHGGQESAGRRPPQTLSGKAARRQKQKFPFEEPHLRFQRKAVDDLGPMEAAGTPAVASITNVTRKEDAAAVRGALHHSFDRPPKFQRQIALFRRGRCC